MQVRDERAWAEQLTEFEADETSKKFGLFLQEWVKNLQNEVDNRFPLSQSNPNLQVAHAASKSLEVTEQTMGGYLSVEWIAQMLLVICDHWVRGEDLFESMSSIEQRLVQQAATMKLAELQAAASITTEE